MCPRCGVAGIWCIVCYVVIGIIGGSIVHCIKYIKHVIWSGWLKKGLRKRYETDYTNKLG